MALHQYSLDDSLNVSERLHVTYKLAAVSSVLVGGLSFFLAQLTEQWSGVAVLSAPSTIVVYLFLVRQVEINLWCKPAFRFLLGITLPEVKGVWDGTVETRRRDGQDVGTNTGTMTITQTWSTIGIEFMTDRIRSHSVGAFMTRDAANLILTIEYRADVRLPHRYDPNVLAHRGTCRYYIPMTNDVCDLNKIEAQYYTDHRETGILKLEKRSNDVMS